MPTSGQASAVATAWPLMALLRFAATCIRIVMATLPVDTLQTIDHYGPHKNYAHGEQLNTAEEPDNLVKTHCCFCGQQCGIQLKVKDNEVIGFEPWEDFPFNRGMLCPKGVKRYLQNSHPDRLLSPLVRTEAGFRNADWPE